MHKMLADYLRSFWRGVLHNKVATLINVGGLAVGLAVFFALSFYVDREFSWDSQWDDADRIYRAAGTQEAATGNISGIFTTPPYVMGTALQSRHPEAFEIYARALQLQSSVFIGEEEYPNLSRTHAEPALLELLQFETLEGSLDEVFADPRSIAISKAMAERYFADTSPLGKVISFGATQNFFGGPPGERTDYIIKAVFDLPAPTTFGIPFLAVLEATALPMPNVSTEIWQGAPVRPTQPGEPPAPRPVQPLNVSQYFKIREGVDIPAIVADLRSLMDENAYMQSPTSKTRFAFQNIQDIHLTPSLFEPGDNVQRLRVYAAIGVLVLLISGCNFVMLATLRLVDRMREVGIRKSLGGGAGQLMRQYLMDAFLHTLVAAILAVSFLAFAFPKLQVMLELPLQIDLLTPRNLSLSLLMVVIFTLLSSAYPAWLVSQGKPGPLLRNGASAVVGTGTGLRKLLVGIQFAIVVVLLLATAVVRQQIEYTKNRDPGYSLENVVATSLTSFDQFPRSPTLVAEFRQVPGVVGAAAGGVRPNAIMISPPTIVRATAADGTVREAAIQQMGSGGGYFDVMSVRILAGREFSTELDTEPSTPPATPFGPDNPPPERRIVLNESAARLLGFTAPEAAVEQLLETTITPQGGPPPYKQIFRVIGVVADTQFSSAMLPPVAQMYSYNSQNQYIAVKLAPDADVTAVTSELEEVFTTVMNGADFVPVDPTQANAFTMRREQFEARIITGSTLLAIVIALLGLYGLVAATVVKRVKEIGVRKVMGAEPKAIVTLFLWQFSQPIALANLLAWPFGFWAITQWMQRFPYQLDVAIVVLSGLVASIVALLIAWVTVGVMAAKAATVKPVLALRYE
jgi:putative ABC transport system permease protein